MVNGVLPNAACTPGNINPGLTKEMICGPDFYTSDYRDNKTTPTKRTGHMASTTFPAQQEFRDRCLRYSLCAIFRKAPLGSVSQVLAGHPPAALSSPARRVARPPACH